VSQEDRVAAAAAELYGAALAEFVPRRAELATAARTAGDRDAAKRIAALRKPTQSAWVLNQLVRTVPDAMERINGLGGELRAAQRSLDGAAIRELSTRRRVLVDDLTREALAATGQRTAAAGLRDELTTTLSAALADPQVAQQLAAGALERAAPSAGFGAPDPALTLVPPPDDDEPVALGRAHQSRAQPKSGPAKSGQAKQGPAKQGKQAPAQSKSGRRTSDDARRAVETAAPPSKAEQRRAAAEQARAETERRHQVAEQARAAADAADEAAQQATALETDAEATVTRLTEELADAREALTAARTTARRARARQRQARQAADRHAR
jgi:hypothetical protein